MRALGNIAETKACKYLIKNDFDILERNFYSRFGELDIIAFKNNILHFVEVKSGQYNPIENITSSKIKKLIKTIDFYLNTKKLNFDYCLDAIIVTDKIEFIENITL
ncbi:MAG: Unknown protein [uncultured Campylobacterales bacterium]|uniref:UPF0102 protein HELGO_WM5934 n=1 Tax=uncultured Campylobacterales bacterium TaxID=352960 RepID=A0A6S6SZ95_9BACT|nr:MAG: Unknown protein [uncultured Campylobacterales bacterium]